ncbi:hypothetical protein [Desulfopila inferna]|uniref:hypothetical protein n=1 Tax=Desulfopila inferna TaxID=468528 RepID=UPI0019668964|nr:hypothetical protein [Desulfopila inferna]MBM9604781.1 hypothetical protein [Desulfopila inferna]
MNSLNLKTYLLYAIYIVRTHPRILLFLAAVGLLNGLIVYFPKSGFADLVSSITILSAIFISPVIYGIYYEIIEEKYSSIATVFRTYVGGYLLLLFCMYIPVITATAMLMSSTGAGENTAYVMLTILFFSMLFIYVVPAYFVSGKIIDSLIYGVSFFFRNIAGSAPLLLMALASEMLLLLSHFTLGGLKENSPSLFVVLDFFIYMTASILDFLLFIMLVYILRSSDIKKR